MKAELRLIAMVRYESFWDGLFSLPTFSMLLLTASIAAFVIAVCRIARNSPLHTAYFSALLCLCLLPFVLCAASALADLFRLHGDWRSYYPSLWASNFIHMTIFGAVLSTIATAYYTFNRKQTSA